MGALGFFFAIHPLVYVIGFKDEDAVAKSTLVSFIILSLFVLARVLQAELPILGIFETGSLFMGSFVGYLGLLTASSKWYGDGSRYGVLQITTVLAGLLALYIRSVWQISELQRDGGTFFVLYIVEKMCEIPVQNRKNYAYLGLAIPGLIFAFCMAVRSNPEAFRPYLLF